MMMMTEKHNIKIENNGFKFCTRNNTSVWLGYAQSLYNLFKP